jgi:beta-N-acetylhexosaminidase
VGPVGDATLVEAVVTEIVTAIGDGRLELARVEEAASRVSALAAWTQAAGGVRPAGGAGPAGGGANARAPAGLPAAEPDLGYWAALAAVRVEGRLEGLTDPMVVQLESESSIAVGRVPWGLGPHLAVAAQLRVIAERTDADTLREAARGRPIVFVGRNVHRLPGAPELIQNVAVRHPVVVVEMGWPSSWRPRHVRAFVMTYGASHANGRAAAQTLGLTG